VLFVADIDRSVDFYVKHLGFTQPWRYEEEGKARVAQVERQGCALILSSQWPDKVGKGLMFLSLDVGVLDAVRAEFEWKGVEVRDGYWGYRLMVIVDPDGNELYFNYPAIPRAHDLFAAIASRMFARGWFSRAEKKPMRSKKQVCKLSAQHD
jgi:catechol 2,3-dioxygenase-like lactoylglutathione lyase family enzyme